ncbi:MAG TPA: zinc-dependent dehydrogenase [Candidatus Omnitrophota bacterium]|nr:zinc-dependent dehydrogenase [Candidatus Omnitrophota bacterium]HPN66153.1 zinc-dependent dehydrogenase [Candidatus Omnitrophota bacterium]
MRVAMYYANDDVRTEEMPVPEAGGGEILVRVIASGICGSDVMEWYRKDRVPLVLGHEIAGTVEKIGAGVKGLKPGDRVAVSHHVPCGSCRYCLKGHETACETLRKTNFFPGGFAEFVRVPAINIEKGGVYQVPDNVTFEEATFIEPLACVLRGQRIAGVKKGDTVLVIGSGISGLLHVKYARASGAGVIAATDLSKYRLDAAARFGADRAFNAAEWAPQKLKDINNGMLADVVIICAGAAPAIQQGLDSVERGGTVLFFAASEKGLTVNKPINDIFWRNEVTLTSSYAATPAEHLEAMRLLGSGKVAVKDMITHRFGIAEAGEGFRLVAEAQDSIKVIINPHS